MTFAFWTNLAAGLLPDLAVALAKSGAVDERAPRRDLERLAGRRRRADRTRGFLCVPGVFAAAA